MNTKTAQQFNNLEFLFNHTKDVVWSIDEELKLVCKNKAFDDFLIRTINHCPQIGESILYEGFGKATLQFWEGLYRRALSGEQFVTELVDERTQYDFSEITMNPITNTKGKVIGAACFVTDISAYKQKEIELREAHQEIADKEEKYRALLDASNDIFLTINEQGLRTYISPSVKSILGYTPEELLGQPVFDHVHPDELAQVANTFFNLAMVPNKETTVRVRFQHKNGTWRHLDVKASNHLHNPAIKAVITNIRDVTEQVEAAQKIEANEQLYRSLAENFPNGNIVLLNPDLTCTYIAGGDLKLYDLDPASYIGLYYPNHFQNEHVALFEEKMQQVLKGKHITFQIPYEGYIYITSGVPLHNAAGEITEILVVSQNITQQKRVEDALRESEEKFRMVSERSPVGIFQVAPNGYCTWMNERMCEICGFTLEDGLGFGYVKYFHPDDRERIVNNWTQYSSNKEATPLIMYRIITQERQIKWAYTQAAPLCNTHGDVVAYVGTLEDISEIKHYQDELLDSRNQLETVLNGMPDGVFFLDNDWTLTYANESAVKILNMSRRDLLGWNMWERFPETVGSSIQTSYLDSKKNNEPFSITEYYAPMDIWFEINGVPNKEGFLVYFRNVSEKKELKYHIDRIYDMSPAMLGIVDSNLHFANFNPALTHTLGYSEKELKERPFYDFVYPDDRNAAINAAKVIMKTKGFTRSFENRYLTKAGDYKWMQWSVYGQPERKLAYFVAHDITEKKHEEEYLRMLESVVTNTKDAVLITDVETLEAPGQRIVYANSAFTATTGYTLAEVKGKSPRLLQGEGTNVKELQKLKNSLLNWQPHTCELLNYKKDGTPFWVNITITPIADSNGWFTHWVSVQRDITHIKEAELRLLAFARQQESLAYLGYSVTALNDLETIYRTCVASLSLTLDIEFIKVAMLDKQTGKLQEVYSAGLPENISKNVAVSEDSHACESLKTSTDIVINNYKDELKRQPSSLLLKAGAKSGMSIVLHGNDGPHGVLGVYAIKPRNYTTDEINYVKAVANILSGAIKRIEASEKLNLSEKKYRLLFEENPLPLWIFDPETLEYHDVNDAAIRHYGYSREEFLNMKISDIRPHEDIKKLKESVAKVNENTYFSDNWKHRKKNGQIISVEISSNPITLDGHNYRLTLANDVTQKKELEAEKLRYQEQLEKTVQDRTAQLLESNHELEAFNYTVSHDLRTPIRAIQMFVSLLERDDSAQDARKEYTNSIKSCTDEMTSLINDLLEFSKIRRQELNWANIDMEALAAETAHYLVSMEEDKDIDIKIDKLHPVRADRVLLKSVWQNFISNAIKYSKQKSTIHIHISSITKGNTVEYCIADNGVGFDMQYLGKLFKPFSRLHSSSEYKGTGAGLAIVDRIVSRHGGHVGAESERGKGSKFYFTLPLNHNKK